MRSFYLLIFTSVAVILSSAIAFGQGGSTYFSCEFTNLYGSSGLDQFSTMYHDEATNEYIVGGIDSGLAVVCKIDSTGILQYTRRIQIPAIIHSIIKAGNNNDILTATVANDDVQICRINSQGTLFWAKQFSTARERYVRLINGSGDNYFVVCWYTPTSTADDLVIMNIDGSGNILWSKKYHYGDDQSNWMIPNGSGGLIVTGGTFSAYFRSFILELDESGNEIQNVLLTASNSQSSQIYRLAKDNNNNFIATGYVTINGERETFVMKMNSTFGIDWVKILTLPGQTIGVGIDCDQYDNIYVSHVHYVNNQPSGAVSRFSPTGDHVWSKHNNGLLSANMTVSNNNGVNNILLYSGVENHSMGFGGRDAFFMKEDMNFDACVNLPLTPAISSSSFNSSTWAYTVSNFALGASNYSTSISNANISVTSICDTCQTLTSIADLNSRAIELKVYPIPADVIISAEFKLLKSTGVRIDIIDALGRVLQSEEIQALASGKHSVKRDVSNLPPGIYLLSINTKYHRNSVRFLVN